MTNLQSLQRTKQRAQNAEHNGIECYIAKVQDLEGVYSPSANIAFRRVSIQISRAV